MASVSPKHRSEELDPRIQIELEKLNKASNDINKLELELERVRGNFQQILTGTTQQLNALSKNVGTSIEKARPYYEARMRAKEAQLETQNAALRFERACGQLAAAKETVTLAEEGFFKKGQAFDPAWQEMLNHATMKVNEAEKERLESELEHEATAAAFNEAELNVKELYRDLKKHIQKSKPYFELKARFTQTMQEQKSRADTLENAIVLAKHNYSQTLHNLEKISDEIHLARQEAKIRREMGSRGAGVGAETPFPSVSSESPSQNTEKNCCTEKVDKACTKTRTEEASPVHHSKEIPSLDRNSKLQEDENQSKERNIAGIDNSKDMQENSEKLKSKKQKLRKDVKGLERRRSYEEAIEMGPSEEVLSRSDLLRHQRLHNINSELPIQHPSFTPNSNKSGSPRRTNEKPEGKFEDSKSSGERSELNLPTNEGTSKLVSKAVSSGPKTVFSLLSSLRKSVNKTNADSVSSQNQNGRTEEKDVKNTASSNDVRKVTQNLVLESEDVKEKSFLVNETVREISGKVDSQRDLHPESHEADKSKVSTNTHSYSTAIRYETTLQENNDQTNAISLVNTEEACVANTPPAEILLPKGDSLEQNQSDTQESNIHCNPEETNGQDPSLPSLCIFTPENAIEQPQVQENVIMPSQCMAVTSQRSSSQAKEIRDSIEETPETVSEALNMREAEQHEKFVEPTGRNDSAENRTGGDDVLLCPAATDEELSDSSSQSESMVCAHVLDDDQIERALADFDETVGVNGITMADNSGVMRRNQDGRKDGQDGEINDYKTLPKRLSYLQEYVTGGSLLGEQSVETDTNVCENDLKSDRKSFQNEPYLGEIYENYVTKNDNEYGLDSRSGHGCLDVAEETSSNESSKTANRETNENNSDCINETDACTRL